MDKSSQQMMTFLMHFSWKMGAENHEKSKLFLILFRKRENVKIAASCRRERQNEGLEGSERQQKTDPKQLQKSHHS